MSSEPGFPISPPTGADDSQYSLENWVKNAIDEAPNRIQLQAQLDSIRGTEALVCFLHRYVLVNDALAARVPFLAGLIHLTPDLFVDPEGGVEFCRQANGRIAAFVAEAASDEYRITGGRSMVHQYLSQRFFLGTLAHFGIDQRTFDRLHPIPQVLSQLLEEARTKFFDQKGPGQIFPGLGFHVGLEFFAHQEFNMVDAYLRSNHPKLVDELERERDEVPNYTWLSLHTVVEIGHYRAGLQALQASLKYCQSSEIPARAAQIKHGFMAFVDLQRRYHQSILLHLD
jgi:hypothetical protein